MHAALGFWQAGRADEAWRIAQAPCWRPCSWESRRAISAPCPTWTSTAGNRSGISAIARARCRAPSWRDSSGVKPDALAGELLIRPGFPPDWLHASFRHPDLAYSFRREGARDTYVVEPRFAEPQRLRLQVPATRARIAAVEINGQPADWRTLPGAEAASRRSPGIRFEILAPAAARTDDRHPLGRRTRRGRASRRCA